jgi:hypothetical protein
MPLGYCRDTQFTILSEHRAGLAVPGDEVRRVAQLEHCVHPGFKGQCDARMLVIDTIKFQCIIGEYALDNAAIDSIVQRVDILLAEQPGCSGAG